MSRFLADNRRFRQQPRQPFGKNDLCVSVGHGHDVVGRLGGNLVRGKLLVARQDRPRSGLADHGVDAGGEGVAHDSGIMTWLGKPSRRVRREYHSATWGRSGRGMSSPYQVRA